MAFESIATATPSSGTSEITFSSISSSYDHYFITFYYTPASGTGNSNVLMRFNGDSGTNYSQIRTTADTGLGYNGNADTNQIDISDVTSTYASCQIWVIGTQTSRWKTVWAQGSDMASGGRAKWNYGAWMSTSAINSITLFLGDSRNLGSNCVAALYGVKGA